jgi:hypothetical protein
LLVSSKLIVEFTDGDEVLPRPTVVIPVMIVFPTIFRYRNDL